MKNTLLFLLFPMLLMCCKNNKTASGKEEITIDGFIKFFPEIKLPYQLSDSMLDKKEKDTSAITYSMFSGLVPDTVLERQFGKKAQPAIYPLGRVAIKKGETYLFVKAATSSKKAGYVLVFDNEQKFRVAKPLVITEKNSLVSRQADMDGKYTITTIRRRKGPDGEALYQKEAFVYNSEGIFTLILTESNDVSRLEKIIWNPIDTLPRVNKYSGDYVIDEENFVSVRDGRTAESALFFIHFEKSKGTCTGELKGEAVFTSATKAVFTQNNGPCSVEFAFGTGKVAIKESGACGTYRDIKCFFEGSYPKKKVKPVKPVKSI
ncbi:MAG: hypothetical protein H7Y03_07150 [Chitinophagaceae bacterium]|nr:hypothetical protein [Chitinophagaceae bacterium]